MGGWSSQRGGWTNLGKRRKRPNGIKTLGGGKNKCGDRIAGEKETQVVKTTRGGLGETDPTSSSYGTLGLSDFLTGENGVELKKDVKKVAWKI